MSFISACGAATSLAIHWRISMVFISLMLLFAAIDTIFKKQVTLKTLNGYQVATFLSMVLFLVVYAISLSYSDNLSEGHAEVERKMLFLVFGIAFLIFNFSYITNLRINTILQLLTVALLIRFAVYLAIVVANIAKQKTSLFSYTGSLFDPLHHGYLSMYILLSIAYLIRIAFSKSDNKAHLPTVIVSILLLATYLFFIQSRAGILIFILMIASVISYIIFARRLYKLGLALVLGIAVVSIVAVVALPNSFKRLSTTTNAVVEGDFSDARFTIAKVSLQAIGKSLPFGVGAGDRQDILHSEYKALDNSPYSVRNYNCHNQFLDTLLATGLPGLAILLIIFGSPTVYAIKNKDYLLIGFISITFISALVESILERQIGIPFFCLFLCIFMARCPEALSSNSYNQLITNKT